MHTAISSISGGITMGDQLFEVGRCPSCSVVNPVFIRCWTSPSKIEPNKVESGWYWGTYVCTTCNQLVLAKAAQGPGRFIVISCTPEPKQAHEDIPIVARRFLQQAFETLHAPDAAAVMAGSAVDAMLKELGYVKDSLYVRIDQALADNVITASMAEWAHSVRLGANRPRHADSEAPHVSGADAIQAVEFAEALGHFLFVLSARIRRGIEASQAARGSENVRKPRGS